MWLLQKNRHLTEKSAWFVHDRHLCVTAQHDDLSELQYEELSGRCAFRQQDLASRIFGERGTLTDI